jgi:competence protein ComEC
VTREPLLLPAIALAAGILAAHFIPFTATALAAACVIVMAGVLLAIWKAYPAPLVWSVVCLASATAGIGTQMAHRPGRTPRLNVEDTEVVLLSGCVVNPPVFSPGREQFTLKLGRRASIRLSVTLKDNPKLPLSYGQRVEATAKVRSPRNFQNPDSFDFIGYLANQQIYWTGTVSSPSDIHTEPGACGHRAVGWLYSIRTWALERLTELYPNDQHTAGLLQATLLGETSGVERRWTNEFRVTGTYHALVISGQHISVLALTLLLLLRLLQFRSIPALFVTTAVTWLYAFISGFSAPVVRAAGGFTLFMLASYFFRRTRILNVLWLVGIVYLLFDPIQLFDPSFQLSFLSAAAIAAFAIPVMERYTEPLRASIKRFDQISYDPQVEMRAAEWRVELRLFADTLHAWTGLSLAKAQWVVAQGVLLFAIVADAMIVSACVQFGLALPMVTYFHRLSVTGLTANIVVVPLLSLVIPFGFAAILTGLHPLAQITGMFLKWSEAVAAWHMNFEPAWRIGAIPLGISLAFSVSLMALAIAVRRGGKPIIPAFAGALAFFAIICWQPWKPIVHLGKLELTAIDVSQGDSLLMVLPDGETMLIDAGGYPGMARMVRKPQIDMGEDVVSPYLWSRRIRRLDYAILSHGHSDHMAGLPAILDNFRPKQLWVSVEPPSAEWKTVEQHAAADRVPIVSLHRGSPDLCFGSVRIRVLAPAPDYVPGEAAGNNDSLVLEVSYGKRSILLTGDAERPIEDDMVNSGQLRNVTLLKVGHHGSKTSSSEEFLSQLSPEFAFISDGYKNQFHHPHPTVLERLAQHHAAVYRTDERGLTTFLTDGDKVEIKTFH